jgi:hypothetical protein
MIKTFENTFQNSNAPHGISILSKKTRKLYSATDMNSKEKNAQIGYVAHQEHTEQNALDALSTSGRGRVRLLSGTSICPAASFSKLLLLFVDSETITIKPTMIRNTPAAI